MRRTEPSGRTRLLDARHDLRRIPRDPGAWLHLGATDRARLVVGAPLRLPEPVAGTCERAQGVLPERLAQDVEGRLAAVGAGCGPARRSRSRRDSAGSCPAPRTPTGPVPSSRSAAGRAGPRWRHAPDVGEVRRRCGRPSTPGGRRRRCRHRRRWARRSPAVMAAIQRIASSRSSSIAHPLGGLDDRSQRLLGRSRLAARSLRLTACGSRAAHGSAHGVRLTPAGCRSGRAGGARNSRHRPTSTP